MGPVYMCKHVHTADADGGIQTIENVADDRKRQAQGTDDRKRRSEVGGNRHGTGLSVTSPTHIYEHSHAHVYTHAYAQENNFTHIHISYIEATLADRLQVTCKK